MGRYKDLFNLGTSLENVPSFTIRDRETDIYVTFDSSSRLDGLSNTIYGSPEYWWIILNANDYQMEFEIPYGEILRVPFPLSDVVKEIKGKVQ